MPVTLDRGRFNDVLNILAPFMATEKQRSALLLLVFDRLSSFDLSGDPNTVAVTIVRRLCEYTMDSGESGIEALLQSLIDLKWVDQEVGTKLRDIIIELADQRIPETNNITRTYADAFVEASKSYELVETLYAQLLAAEQTQSWGQVIEIGERILKLKTYHRETNVKTANAYYERGMFQGRTMEYARGLEDATRAIQLFAKADYFYLRGLIYVDLKRLSEAIEDFSSAIDRDHNAAKYHFERGKAYFASKDYRRAISNYDYALSLESQNAEYYFWRGRAWYARQKFERALADFTRAIELEAKISDYYQYRAFTFSHLGRMEESKRDDNTVKDLLSN